MTSSLLRVVVCLLCGTVGVFASIDSYVAMLVTNRPSISAARFKYTTSNSSKFTEMHVSKGKVLLKIAPSEKSLATDGALTTDLKLRAQIDGGYWTYTWDAGGFMSTDYDSMRLDGSSQGWGVARAFQADAFFGELPFLGIPDFWDSYLQVDSVGLVWSYQSTNSQSPRKSFTCRLRKGLGQVEADIEYPSRMDSYRVMRKRIVFDKSESFPSKLICSAGSSTNELSVIYTIDAIGGLRFEPPDPAAFVMTNYFGPGSRGYLAYRGGKTTFTHLSDHNRTSIRVLGFRISLDAVRAGLWGGFVLLTITVIWFLTRKNGN